MTGSNCRPSRCKRDALPTELIAHSLNRALRRFSRGESGITPLRPDRKVESHAGRVDLLCIRIAFPAWRLLHQNGTRRQPLDAPGNEKSPDAHKGRSGPRHFRHPEAESVRKGLRLT